jgi:alpha-galactosidase
MSSRITIIGGGSSMFVPTLLRRILNAPSLRGSTVCLMDVDAGRLATMTALAKALVKAEKADLHIESSGNQREALTGATFVIVAISVGGMASWEADIEIPGKYGVYMQIADSVGPAGMMRAFRNLPVIASITHDLAEVSPDAWVFNYSNPAAACAMAMATTPSVKSVSLCSCTFLAASGMWMEHVTGIPADQFVVPSVVGGINHCAGILKLRLKDGRDALPIFREKSNDVFVHFAYDTYGVIPYCSNHWAEFYPQLQYLEDKYEGRAQGLMMKRGLRIYDMTKQRARVQKWQDLAERWAQPENSSEVSLANLPPGDEDWGIEVIDIIAAILENRNQVFVVNTINNGGQTNLPADAVVEVSALVNAYGIHPMQVGEIPEAWAAHLRQHIATQKLTVQAALSGDRHIALQAFIHDPLLAARLEPEQSAALLDEMLEANERFLPQFARKTPVMST